MLSFKKGVPPPVIAALAVALAWLIARKWAPQFGYFFVGRVSLTAVCVAIGGVIGVWSLILFRLSGTTTMPHTPERSCVLVQGGPYRISRNPMYLAIVCGLLGVCVYLGNPLSLVSVAAFIAYITRFQIALEERVLQEKFGEAFTRYRATVRRWI